MIHTPPVRWLFQSAVALLWAIGHPASAQVHGESTQWLTFVEVRVEVRGHAANIFRERKPASSPGRMIFLQDLSRPERFALLEDIQSVPAGGAREMDTLQASLADELIAPLDRRANHQFEQDTGANGARVDAHANFYVIAHLDLATHDLSRIEAALHQFAVAARRIDGNLGFEIWQQTDRPNHFNLISAWTSESPLHTFEATRAAREFRQLVGPLLGSPYDERLFRRAD